MSELVSELQAIYEELQSIAQSLEKKEFLKPLDALEKSATDVGKAWGHSWLGYQSRVYYESLEAPPPGAHFSSEWGFKELHTMGTRGNWEEFAEDAIETEIRRRAGHPDMSNAQKASDTARDNFRHKRDDIISILRAAKGKHDDTFLEKLLDEAEREKAFTKADFIEYMRPSGQIMSRDMIALSQGLWTPPHLSILADVMSLKAPKRACESLAAIARRAFSHLERTEKRQAKADRVGTNVFIGHGRSKEWKDLKDFINDRMRLPWDEFNRVAVAGIPNTVRLSTMLDAAAIAFLVLTAEDERADSKMQARMNVIHEAGLFQGRLGFSKAIVMLEEGCEEFSNIEGLGQIRFPKNNIKAAFHDVQLVLEREGLVEAPQE
ncbi:TIR domain-containing protein [Paludibaculum fermentans]|uniref:TIR domain-containing protein n=1 Tax=Paludibaculum fermentans TaxID=1473598 RepID=UPI003EBEA14F